MAAFRTQRGREVRVVDVARPTQTDSTPSITVVPSPAGDLARTERIGVEEEFHVVDLATARAGAARPRAARPATGGHVHRRAAALGGGEQHAGRQPPRRPPHEPAHAAGGAGVARRRPRTRRRGGGHRPAGQPVPARPHRQRPLPADAPRLPAPRPRAAHLRHPGPCRRARPRRGRRRRPPALSVAAGAARAVGQLALLDGRRQRLRQLPLSRVAALADRRRQRQHHRRTSTTAWSPIWWRPAPSATRR